MSNPTQFPPYNLNFMNSDGTNNDLWYRFHYGIWKQLGGATNTNITVIAAEAAQAQIDALAAGEKATLAQTTAQTADNNALAAQATANQAITIANTASGATGSFLIKVNNLSDVSNFSTARRNLGVDVFPITFTFDTLSNGLTRYVPLVRGYTLPTNFVGSLTWCGTFATVDAVFTVKYIRGGITTTIGTITLIHGGIFNAMVGSATTLQAGDILEMICPSPADVSLANVGITLKMTLA